MKKYLIENHDMAYDIWKREGIVNGTLFHFDAHFDYSSFNDSYMTIGNFIGKAAREGITGTIVWVIPSPSFEDVDILEKLTEQVCMLFQKEKREKFAVVFSNDICRLYVTCLSGISCVISDGSLTEKYLIDIDIDFFMNHAINTVYSNIESKCWCKVDFFIENIRKELCVEDSIVTISRSVLGGYTPLLFNYLADEIYECISEDSLEALDEYRILENAIDRMNMNDYSKALDLFNKIKSDGIIYHTSLIGSAYCYGHINSLDLANEKFLEYCRFYPEYEKYLFPIHSFIDGLDLLGYHNKDRIDKAQKMVDMWLQIQPDSDFAKLYYIKLGLIQKKDLLFLEKILDSISDENTLYEKSYVQAFFFFCFEKLEKAIQSCQKVIDFIEEVDTPIWAGQISSFEKRINNGKILGEMLQLISVSYEKTGNHKKARLYARICLRIGVNTPEVLNILDNKELRKG